MTETMELVRARANLMRTSANALCVGRIILAPIIAGMTIASELHAGNYRGWAPVTAIGAVWASDKLDGWLAKTAAKQLKEPTTAKGAWLDQMSDKALYHGILGGLAISECLAGNYLYGTTLAAIQLGTLGRDTIVTKWRNYATKHDVDTKAQRGGQIKTAVNACFLTAAYAPLTQEAGQNLTLGQGIIVGGLFAGLSLAIKSGLDYVKQFKSATHIPLEGDLSEIKEPTTAQAYNLAAPFAKAHRSGSR